MTNYSNLMNQQFKPKKGPRVKIKPPLENNLMRRVFKIISANALAQQLGLSQKGVYKWMANGLPSTELTGDTTWAKQIAEATDNQVTEEELLAWSFPNRPPCACQQVGSVPVIEERRQTPDRRSV
jgi:predicted DNA-binding transcriptional regulator AlpA